MTMYCVIDFDLKNSRSIHNRKEFQENLEQKLQQLSNEYQSILVRPIELTLGDEWVVTLHNMTYAYDIYVELYEFLIPYEIYCYAGFGIGALDATNLSNGSVLTGSAIRMASYSLSIAKQSCTKYTQTLSSPPQIQAVQSSYIQKDCSLHISCSLEHSSPSVQTLLEILQTMFANNELLLSNVTPKQWEAILLYQKHLTYHSITSCIPSLSKSMLSDRLRLANYWLMKENEELIRQLFTQLQLDYT